MFYALFLVVDNFLKKICCAQFGVNQIKLINENEGVSLRCILIFATDS